MGKALSFLLSCVALAALGLLALSHHENLLSDLGLYGSFVVVALMAWAVATATALCGALRKGRSWHVVARLLVFVWVPALPPLVYGASGLRSLFARNRRVGKPVNTLV
jgi:hypothetical protein